MGLWFSFEFVACCVDLLLRGWHVSLLVLLYGSVIVWFVGLLLCFMVVVWGWFAGRCFSLCLL